MTSQLSISIGVDIVHIDGLGVSDKRILALIDLNLIREIFVPLNDGRFELPRKSRKMDIPKPFHVIL